MKMGNKMTTELKDKARKNNSTKFIIDGLHLAPLTMEHIDRLRVAGINLINYTATRFDADFAEACIDILNVLKVIASNSSSLLHVKNWADVESAIEKNKIGIIFGLQNAKPVMDNTELIQVLHYLGVRIIQLTYNEKNNIGDGCFELSNCGLSPFGRKVVKELNKQSIIIDLSHCGERTTLEALELSSSPVLISHANVRSICPSVRNKSDLVLDALRKNGGVIGVSWWAPTVYSNHLQRPIIDDLINHIDYIVDRIGIEHVGIGSDMAEGESREAYDKLLDPKTGKYLEIIRDLSNWYTFETRYVEGLDSIVDLPELIDGLFRRGYTDEEVGMIIGGNIGKLIKNVLH